MTGQASLFDVVPHPRARAADPQTALDAARSVTPGRTEAAILELFATERAAMTDDEIVARLPTMHGPTVKSARSRLTASRLLVDSGDRRPSMRGRLQIVWRAS